MGGDFRQRFWMGFSPFGFFRFWQPWGLRQGVLGFPRQDQYQQLLREYKEQLEEMQRGIAEELEAVNQELEATAEE